jgi:hypothetical protein
MKMSALKTLQQKFCSAIIFGGEHEELFLPEIKSSRISPGDLLKIYRNGVFENLCKALQLTFPGVWALLGDECANSIAYAFNKEINNLPNTSVLDEWGGAFPDFLGTVQATSSLPYLKDYAHFEWLSHLSNCAENMPSLSLDVLKKINEDEADNIKFSFQPSVFLFQSIFPIDLIKNVAENPNADSFDLSLKSTYIIIGRSNERSLSYFISESYWKFFTCLKNKYSLQEAFEKVASAEEEFDLTNALTFLLSNKFIHSII